MTIKHKKVSTVLSRNTAEQLWKVLPELHLIGTPDFSVDEFYAIDIIVRPLS